MNLQETSLFSLENYEKEKFSYSQIKVFLQCKLRYKLKYIEKKLSQDQRTTFYLSLGRSLHKFFESFYKNDYFANYDSELIRELLNNCWISKGYQSDSDEEAWLNRSLTMIKNFLNNKEYLVKPLLLEKTFKHEFDDFIISSRIDRIDKIGTSQCEIIDYKVGEKEISINAFDEDFQWAFHYFSSYKNMEMYYRLKPSIITFIYLDANDKQSIKLTQGKIDSGREKINSIIKEIRHTNDFLPRINKFCIDCKFDLICPLIKEIKSKGADLTNYF